MSPGVALNFAVYTADKILPGLCLDCPVRNRVGEILLRVELNPDMDQNLQLTELIGALGLATGTVMAKLEFGCDGRKEDPRKCEHNSPAGICPRNQELTQFIMDLGGQ